MHHMHIDRFAGLDSFVHRRDPRMKIVCAFTFMLAVVLTPDNRAVSYGLYALTIGGAVALSRLPWRYICKRALIVMPFAAVMSLFVPFITPGTTVHTFDLGIIEASVTTEGLIRFAAVLVKTYLSLTATVLLVSTTRFGDLMHAAGALGLPSILVAVLTFMYRYLFILIDEVSHMLLARDLRSPGGRYRTFLASSGGIIGSLFVRSYEYAERLYQAMLARGYRGTPVMLHRPAIHAPDIAGAAGFLSLTAASYLAGGVWLA